MSSLEFAKLFGDSELDLIKCLLESMLVSEHTDSLLESSDRNTSKLGFIFKFFLIGEEMAPFLRALIAIFEKLRNVNELALMHNNKNLKGKLSFEKLIALIV